MDISGVLNSMLPTLSYIINLFDRVFTIFCSYFGIDVTTPSEQETADAPEAAA
ncbi:MAG: hypothetical protein IKJ88_06055 [Clostridia bacterium]|nr:hypothetical protein [Clostridia bacterium]MBR3975408.1 hypothetical protein [Clostridia bacterium]